ncbi:hypothetical protein FISHEDRAFT_9335, partial [Fistulina hepatica ATCC 64428]
ESTITPSSTAISSSTLTATPLDRTGTSVRILLHDTQANLEKFSARVDAMMNGVQSTKNEIVGVGTLFQAEREMLSSNLVE